MSKILNASTYLAAATTSGQNEPVHFSYDQRSGGVSVVTAVAQMSSLWQYDGIPGGGAAPGSTARNPTNATDGSLRQANPGAGKQRWLTKVMGASVVSTLTQGLFILYDRLQDISGMSGTSVFSQPVGGSVSRYTGLASDGNEMWVEIYGQIGAVATTATVNYVNQAGDAKTSPAFAIGGTGLREFQRLIKIPFAAGDTGVRSITNITLVLTTGGLGDFGITIARPLVTIPLNRLAIGTEISLHDRHIEIQTDACIAGMLWPQTASAVPTITGYAYFVDN